MTRKPEVYEFGRVIFAKKSAPFEAQYTIQEHARKQENQLPVAAKTVPESTYMDDSMLLACIINYHSSGRRPVCKPENV